MKPYQQSVGEVELRFNTSVKTGLSEQEVERRLREHGHNTLPDVAPDSLLWTFIDQFRNPLIYILVAAAAIIGIVGEDLIDAFIISGVLIFNAVIGTIQERRTQRAIEGLKRFIKTTCVVLRDGSKSVVEDSDLVVGDIVLLKEGQRVPADARIISSRGMQVDEAVLTGESASVHKTSEAIEQKAAVGDRTNMVFRGTYVLSGAAEVIVVATGLKTEIGKIHHTVTAVETEIPLKKEVDRLSYYILLFILCVCVFLLGFGLLMGKPLQELLIMLTALFICVVPEGLPVVLTLVLVTGAYRMAQHRVLMRNLQAVEALGRTDVIVTDKTGTLTRNEMMVSRVFADDKVYTVTGQGYHREGEIQRDGTRVETIDETSSLYEAGVALSLLNNTEITPVERLGIFDIKGSQTEASLYVFSQKVGLDRDDLDRVYKKVYEIPFSPEWSYHAAFYEHNGSGIAFMTGAPEVFFDRSANVTDKMKASLDELLKSGLRVVAVACKKFDTSIVAAGAAQEAERSLEAFHALIKGDLTILAVCGMQDAIRPGVGDIVRQARDAGIDVVVATGDHRQTALYVAKSVGVYKEGDASIDGAEFDALSDEQLVEQLDRIKVYSRVSPDDKRRIVDLYHRQGKIVAMTGDGINDAPSLVAADLGIAMGGIGTEVAKQAADLVLLDDSFESIIEAVAQGRHIFQTLRRVFLYFFATNMGEILIVLFALVANFPLPITAAQILWLNLVTDGFLDVALSMEPQEPGLLNGRWLQKKQRLVDGNLMAKMMYIAIPMGLVSLWVFSHYYEADLKHARTMTLVTMAMFQWFNAWNCRSETRSIFQVGLLSNRWLLLATTFVLFLQFFLLHSPFMQHIFKTVPLSLHDWSVILLVSAPIVVLDELRKWYVRRAGS